MAASQQQQQQQSQPLVASRANSVSEWIEANLGSKVTKGGGVGGGSGWSSATIYSVEDGRQFFVKTARGMEALPMFTGEALGLQAMYDTHTIRIPKVYGFGELDGPGMKPSAFIVMEALNIRGRADQAELGRRMAQMHLATPKDEKAAAGYFGFPVTNTIGGTIQPNPWTKDWVEFFREHRLGYMLRLAGDAKLNKLGAQLLPNLGKFFKGCGPIRPSVLHGDVWSGNVSAADGEPCIFDPATYYGHHEAEWGMAWCCSLGPAFWQEYHKIIPRDPGWEERHQLYLLYHFLNHYVLFGSSYKYECVSIMESLVAKL